MKTLLHLNSSPHGNYSVSRKLSSEVVAAVRAVNFVRYSGLREHGR